MENLHEPTDMSFNTNAPTTQKKSKVGWIIAIVAVLAVIASAGIFMLFNGSKVVASDPRAGSNFNNGGWLAFDDKKLYFIGLLDENDKKKCVYSTLYTGKDKTLVSSDSDINKIRISNGKIFYSALKDKSYTIGFMDKDGSNDQVITEIKQIPDIFLKNFDASNKNLYYLYHDELREHPIHGGEDRLLLEDVKDFVLAGKTIYYATESAIFSYDIKKDKSIKICSAKADQLVLDKKTLYFKNDNGIYSLALSGKEKEKQIVEDTKVGNFVLAGEDIYYIQQFEIAEMVTVLRTMDVKISDSNIYYWAVYMLGTGRVKKVPLAGGDAESVSTNTNFAQALFVSPEGIYTKKSILSDELQPAEFE